MESVLDARQRIKHACLNVIATVALSATAGGVVFAQTPAMVDAPKPGGTVKLYSAPDPNSSATETTAVPLAVQGASEHGFYPVKVDGKSYWVDGMSVKVVRSAKIARCSESAGIQSAGTLGAAANRCN